MSLDDLIQAHLDGSLGEAQARELAGLLKTRPDARDAFARALRQDVLLGEALSDAAEERNDAPRRPWRGIAAAAALVLSFGSLFVLPSAELRLASSQGAVRFDGARLETGEGAAAVVVMADGTRLHAGGETALEVEPGRVVLRHGTLAADVARQAPGRALVFRTPQAEARVLGTRLVLAVDADSTLCRVEEGRVRLERDGQAVVLGGGDCAVATADARPLKAETPARPSYLGPSIRLVEPSSWPSRYAVYPFRTDSLLYADRGWRITRMPESLEGALGIATRGADKMSDAGRLLVFEIDRPMDVWVGLDRRATKLKRKPSWLTDAWSATGLSIHSRTAGNSTYDLFRRRFPAGIVSLGGNHCGGPTGAGVNYVVLLTPP